MNSTKRTLIIGVVLAFAVIAGVAVVSTMVSQQPASPDLVAVPVAAMDIPDWTRFTKDNVGDYFVFKQFPRDSVPPNAVLDLEELGGKWAGRTIRQGETVEERDLETRGFIDSPDGTVLMTVGIIPDANTAGFILPRYKVNVLATKKSQKKQKEIVFPLFDNDVLILSVGANTGVGPYQTISIAVPANQVELVTEALEGGATICFRLSPCGGWSPHETDREIFLAVPKTSNDVRAALADN